MAVDGSRAAVCGVMKGGSHEALVDELVSGRAVVPASMSYPDNRQGSPFPADEHWEGNRTWRPERDRRWRGQLLPDRFTIDKPGKCEVQCVRDGRSDKCKEYRC
jgi:hypothetical protein